MSVPTLSLQTAENQEPIRNLADHHRGSALSPARCRGPDAGGSKIVSFAEDCSPKSWSRSAVVLPTKQERRKWHSGCPSTVSRTNECAESTSESLTVVALYVR